MTDPLSTVDTAELETFLAAEFGEPIREFEVLNDGLNLVLAVSTGEGGGKNEDEDEAQTAEAASNEYVLRRPNKLRQTPLFDELEREYRILQRLQDTAIRAPKPVLFCKDASLLGEPFFVTTRLEGEPIPLGSDLPDRFQNPRARRRLAERVVDVLADVHSVAPEPFEDVCEQHSAQEQVANAAGRLETVTSVTGCEFPRLWTVKTWLD